MTPMTPSTSQQELQLSDDLRQIVAGQPFVPDLGLIERRGRRQRRRGLALRGTAALGVTLAVGLAGLTAVGHGGTAHGSAAHGGAAHGGAFDGAAPGAAAGPPATQTAAYVTAHAEAALKGASHYLIRITQHGYSGGAIHELTDPRTGFSYSVQGTGASKVEYWESTFFVARVLHWRGTEADFGSRTWFTSVIHAAGPVQGPLPQGPSVPGGSPAQIRQWLKQGHFTIVGHGVVDGHQATHLRAVLGPIITDLWVDAQNFRPVRLVRNINQGALKGHPISFDETWIARSAALVQLASHPQIPGGFTKVPPPA
jgi:hypothetical protein